MSNLGDIIHRIMRDVSALSPVDPSIPFIQMLEAKGLTIVSKVEGTAQLVQDKMGVPTQPVPASIATLLPDVSAGLGMAAKLIADAKRKAK